MSDENVTFNINWDLDVDETVESGPRTITDYGTLEYFGAHKVQAFATGEKFQVPGLRIKGEPYSRGGLKAGHEQGRRNIVMHFFKFTGLTFTNDEKFERVVSFSTLTGIKATDKLDSYPVLELNEGQKAAREAGKEVYISEWSNLQFPALKQIPAETRKKLTSGEKVYFSANQWNTGAPPTESKTLTNEDGTPRKFYDHYWYNFTIYGSEAEMLAARSASKGSNGVSLGVDDLPQEWVSAGGDRNGLYADIKERYDKGQAFKTILKKCDLEGQTVSGQPINAQKLVAAALDQPEALLESWFNA